MVAFFPRPRHNVSASSYGRTSETTPYSAISRTLRGPGTTSVWTQITLPVRHQMQHGSPVYLGLCARDLTCRASCVRLKGMGAHRPFRRRDRGPDVLIGASPPLFGVAGLDRQSRRPGRFSSASIGSLAEPRQVVVSPSTREITFTAPGGQISITSHALSGPDQYEFIRDWAQRSTYLRSPQGHDANASRDAAQRPFGPNDVSWSPVSILVDGIDTTFEICDLGDGYWAAVGKVENLALTIDSRGVPVDTVTFERLNEADLAMPKPPNLGDLARQIEAGLEERLTRIPFQRVNNWADYWALRDVEVEHIKRVATQNNLPETQRQDLQVYWLDRIDMPIQDRLDRLYHRNVGLRGRSRIQRHLRWNWLYQLWSNTVGPGARTWFGNRYTPIRRYTFRLWWRP